MVYQDCDSYSNVLYKHCNVIAQTVPSSHIHVIIIMTVVINHVQKDMVDLRMFRPVPPSTINIFPQSAFITALRYAIH